MSLSATTGPADSGIQARPPDKPEPALTNFTESASRASPVDTTIPASFGAIQRSEFDATQEPAGSGYDLEAGQTYAGPQSVPLQDAWPVKRLDHPEDRTAQRLPVEEPFGDSPELNPTRPSIYEEPRQTLVSSQDHPAASPSPSTIQRKPAAELEKAGLSAEASSDTPTVVQPGAAPMASYVDTAVGPLPADLWTILDKEPPRSGTGQATMSKNPSSVPAQAGTLSSSFTPATSTIQRQPVESAPQTQSTQPASTTSASEKSDADSSPDIEGIARQVYAILRRRLITEWERMRR